MRCRECGAELKDDQKFCLNCGTEVLGNDSEKTCPNCGADNEADNEFCKNCGYSFNDNYYPPVGGDVPHPGMSMGTIIIISLLVLALFIGIIFMVFQFANNNKKTQQVKTTAQTTENTDNQTQKTAPVQTQPQQTTPTYTDSTSTTPTYSDNASSSDSSSIPSYSDSDQYSDSSSSGSSYSSGGDYIIPDSNQRYLSRSELVNLSEDELCLARNEISARHGRRYNTDWIQEYFNTKSWYNPRYGPEEFDSMVDSLMTELEMTNMETIKSYEQDMGYL